MAAHSPFPGMDPYIEDCGLWEDFHHELISEIRGALAAVLPDRYVVRAGERTYVVLSAQNGEEEFLAQPDIGVTQIKGSNDSEGLGATSGIAAVLQAPEAPAKPIRMRALVETEYREGFLEIREVRPDRKLITCIEVLSPSNKRPGTAGWLQYNRKRQAFLEGAAHFVEADLLRRGRRMPMEDEWPDSPYYLLVARKEEAPRSTAWPAHYLTPLPTIPIPLSSPDQDVTLALQPIIERVYANSHYRRDIDYRQHLKPPLDATEMAWLEERLQQLTNT